MNHMIDDDDGCNESSPYHKGSKYEKTKTKAMARDYDEMEDDNVTEEDLEGNSDECLWCGELVAIGQKFCDEKCEESFNANKLNNLL